MIVTSHPPRTLMSAVVLPIALIAAAAVGGCPGEGYPLIDGALRANRQDATNGGAPFVGSSACRQCHSAYAEQHDQHGHAFALRPVLGTAPATPTFAPRAATPEPPPGYAWTDVAYAIDGFAKSTAFVDADGFLITDADAGRAIHWLLAVPTNGTTPTFAPAGPMLPTPAAFDFDFFAARTTGPARFDESSPQFQDGRRGVRGTWHEAGVQCEACHGPGGGHFTAAGGQIRIDLSRIFVDADSSQTCAVCHARPFGSLSREILAADGFILDQQQWSELQASGAHARFACTVCHDPHRSTLVDRAAAIRNDCTSCHRDTTMAGHDGETFARGDYIEPLTCVSCHMPLATRSASTGTEQFTGGIGRIGDTRTHIFRISVDDANPTAFLTADGAAVLRDEQGRAAVSVEYVCLRCHNGDGLFELTPARAAEIAGQVHRLP